MSTTILINDVSDHRIQMFANLQLPRSTKHDRDSFIVEGRWCVQRLLQSDYRVHALLVERGKDVEDCRRLMPPETPVYSLPKEKLRQLVGFDFHRGLMACGVRPQLPDAAQLLGIGGGPKIALGVIGVSEHENLGSILRSASALGIEHVLIGPRTIDPFARRTIRVSMATVFGLKLFRLERPVEQFAEWKRRGNVRTIITTLGPGATPLADFAMDDRDCILFVGNEAFGIDPELHAVATDRVTIPMHLGTNSLNVSAAAAICMYELAKARVSNP